MRPVMEAAYRDLSEGRVPVVIAPTGYGKTRASPEIYARARSDGIAGGLVHVVPLRSLVRKIYEETFREHGGAYQVHDPRPGPDKSPYLLRGLVVTTLDSYTLNMYRLPVLESLKIEEGLSYGHYYPVYTGVLSAVNVFDEAHLYLSDEAAGQGVIVETLRALIGFLSKTGANIIVETATMKPSTIDTIASTISGSGRVPVIRLLRCPRESPYTRLLASRLRNARRVVIEEVEDEEWLESNNNIRWTTRIYRSWEEALQQAKNYARDGKVLIVANTVKKAVSLYQSLGGEALLIHGRLSARDRKKIEDYLADPNAPRIIVSTQVIEAGVDVNSIAVFTEVAPVESLVQRAGRACRRGDTLEWCIENEGHIGIVAEHENQAVYPKTEVEAALQAISRRLEAGMGIDWRHPCPRGAVDSYTSLIVDVDTGPGMGGSIFSARRLFTSSTVSSVLSFFLENDGVPDLIKSLARLEGWCGLVRNTIMTTVMVGDDYVVTSLYWTLAKAEEILEFASAGGNTRAPIIVGVPLVEDKPVVRGPAVGAWEAFQALRRAPREASCFTLLSRLRDDMKRIAASAGEGRGSGIALYRWGFQAKEGAYTRMIGFIVDQERGGLG